MVLARQLRQANDRRIDLAMIVVLEEEIIRAKTQKSSFAESSPKFSRKSAKPRFPAPLANSFKPFSYHQGRDPSNMRKFTMHNVSTQRPAYRNAKF